jgi:hypothetical protein
MDSTFLGTLLHLQRSLANQGGEFTLVSPSSSCCRLLQQMGLDDVFPTVTAADPLASKWDEICCDIEGPEAFKYKVIEAHQELASLPGKAGEPFRQVVRGLMQDMEARRGK